MNQRPPDAQSTATEILAAFTAGLSSPESYQQEIACAVAEARRLNAFISEKKALFASRRSGPLFGLPVSVKDTIAVEGGPTTGATPAFAELVLQENDAVVRLREAGAVFTGKTNLHELAFGITGANAHTGMALNPFDDSRLAGGSSSGAAISVATGAAAVALGTDTGGSCRIPAAHCGVVGFRPSTGRYPSGGYITLSPSRDTLGIFARAVEDVFLIDRTIMGTGRKLSAKPIEDITLGAVAAESFGVGVDPKLADAYSAMLRQLTGQGVRFVDIDFQNVIKADQACGFLIAVYETVQGLRRLVENKLALSFDEFVASIKSADVRALIAAQSGAEAIPEKAYRQAVGEQQPLLQQIFAKIFTDYAVDALIYPTTLYLPPKTDIGETFRASGTEIAVFPAYSATTRPDSMSGQPSISLPYGLVDALPVGLQLVAPRNSDLCLLNIAAAIEKLLPPRPVPKRKPVGK